jgi:hypothetical protein
MPWLRWNVTLWVEQIERHYWQGFIAPTTSDMLVALMVPSEHGTKAATTTTGP